MGMFKEASLVTETQRSAPLELFVADLDGTLVKETLGIEVARELDKKGIFRQRDSFYRVVRSQGDFPTRCAWLEAVSDEFARSIRGITEAQFQDAVNAVIPRLQPRNGIGACVKHLTDLGTYCIIITGSPQVAARAIADQLGFHSVIGLDLAVVDSIYTGGHKGAITAERKHKILSRLIPAGGKSAGVGDTLEDMRAYRGLDLSMLIRDCGYVLKSDGSSSYTPVEDFSEVSSHLRELMCSPEEHSFNSRWRERHLIGEG